MIGIGQGWQAAVVLADKAVALATNGGRMIGRGAPFVVHGGGLSAAGVALLVAIVGGAVVAVLLGRRVSAGREAPTTVRQTGGADRGTLAPDDRRTITPGFAHQPAVLRARRGSSGEDGRAQARDERR
jgi:hypothetical protein